MVEVSPSWVMMMKMTKTVIFALLAVTLCFCLAYSEDEVYTNNFLVELHHGGQEEAHRIAKRHNFEYRGTVLDQDNLHHFVHKEGPAHSRKRRSVEHSTLESEPSVKEVTQLTGFRRVKRGFKDVQDLPGNANNIPKSSEEDSASNEKENKNWPPFNDPLLKKQWYIKNTGQADGKPGLDLNVQEAWELGYTGKGVTIAIMDDGIDYLHQDLAPNYNAKASYDFSSDDPHPYPRYTMDWFNSHGTRCAGEVSAVAGNGVCGVGIAYDSKIAGIRMLDQPFMTDLIEASSMSHEPQEIDIYSASWGPQDNGETVDGPRDKTLQAIADGVNKGRRGLGSLYVWASGDGGADDDCNCDGYASSMWTISINSAINDGRTALYDESCSSTLASTFSNGRNQHPEAGVATTDLYDNCTLYHSGTSAAAPEAAGIFALALEANPQLSWRDVQHLTVLTSDRNQLYDDHYHWQCNGIGLEFNHLFGFGVLDAGKMVKLAKEWKTVPERFHCTGATYDGVSAVPNGLEGKKLVLRLNTDGCKGKENEVRYLEHTQAIITLNSTRRGDVTIKLTSPMGTKSLLLSSRPNDQDSRDGFQRWPFMTTHTWGEDPTGEWVLEVAMKDGSEATAFVSEWTLVLHGTQVAPYIDEARSKPKCERAVEKTEQLEQEMQRESSEEDAQDPIAGLIDLDDDEQELIGGGPEDTMLEDWYANNIEDEYADQPEYGEEEDAGYYPNEDDWYKEQVYKYRLQQLKRKLAEQYYF
ncbi:neuroendocrine convertase 2-like [Amphiura filiformis]|uniref:neuroendocrine convertase 2-like n=1 Tax=Amphiura filiformis TaxID=82378 RepID=UPI003B21150F